MTYWKTAAVLCGSRPPADSFDAGLTAGFLTATITSGTPFIADVVAPHPLTAWQQILDPLLTPGARNRATRPPS